MKICPKCGTEIERIYCPDCGTKVLEKDMDRQVEYPIQPVSQPYENCRAQNYSGGVSPKSTAIISYMSWIGLIIAFIIGDRQRSKFHLNQALVTQLAPIILSFACVFIPFIGDLILFFGNIFCLVCWGLGLYYACTEQEKEVPILGQIKLL